MRKTELLAWRCGTNMYCTLHDNCQAAFDAAGTSVFCTSSVGTTCWLRDRRPQCRTSTLYISSVSVLMSGTATPALSFSNQDCLLCTESCYLVDTAIAGQNGEL